MRTFKCIIGLVIFISGCINKQTENTDRLVLLNSYERNNKIYAVDSIYLNQKKKNDTLRFIYKTKIDTFMFSFFKPVNNDSSILLLGHTCPLVANRNFKIGNQEFNVLKYYYDLAFSVDEELSIFYHHDYGLLVVFSDGWSRLAYTMEYDSISKVLIDSIINDKTYLYHDNLPPSPPPDSLMMIIMDILDLVDED